MRQPIYLLRRFIYIKVSDILYSRGMALAKMLPGLSPARQARYDYVRASALEFAGREISERNVAGTVAEPCVFKGESARALYLVFSTRRLYLFDMFEGFSAVVGQTNPAIDALTRGASVCVADSRERRKHVIGKDVNFPKEYFRDSPAWERICRDKELVFRLASKVGGIQSRSLSAALLFRSALIVMAGVSMFAAEIDLKPASTNFQALVDGAPEGTTFRFSPGEYKNFSIQPKKGDIFEGAPGVSLNGSTVLTFRQTKPNLWVADAGSLPPETVNAGAPCDPALKNADGSHYTVGCTHARSLYRNGAPLWRVATPQELGPGEWYFDDSSKQASISDDPAGAVLELATLQDAFHGNAQNVTIGSLTIEKYAGPQQHGAINCQDGSGWAITGNTIRMNHSRGIGFTHCDAIKISGNRITVNGNLGIGGCCSKDALAENNEIDNNNYAHFDPYWEAGGIKSSTTTALIARNNKIHDNFGFGLWSDIGAIYTIYDGNAVVNNSYGGILYEISHGAWIVRNTLSLNGSDAKGRPGAGWLYFGQIIVSTSNNVVVESNTVTVGEFGNGITILDQQRESDDLGLLVARDNLVIDNKITYESKGGITGAASDRDKTFENNNIFENNMSLGVNPAGHDHWNGTTVPWSPGFKGR